MNLIRGVESWISWISTFLVSMLLLWNIFDKKYCFYLRREKLPFVVNHTSLSPLCVTGQNKPIICKIFNITTSKSTKIENLSSSHIYFPSLSEHTNIQICKINSKLFTKFQFAKSIKYPSTLNLKTEERVSWKIACKRKEQCARLRKRKGENWELSPFFKEYN